MPPTSLFESDKHLHRFLFQCYAKIFHCKKKKKNVLNFSWPTHKHEESYLLPQNRSLEEDNFFPDLRGVE